jgi:hypothetical protein
MEGTAAINLADRIREMDRRQLSDLLASLRCEFELDFTPEFLGTISIERLKHIVLAACMHARSMSMAS